MELAKYNPDQKKIMAVMAYYALTLYYKIETIKEIKPQSREALILSQSIDSISFAAANIGVSDNDLWEIRRGNIKGLQNLNRIATTVFFDDNYSFDPYGEYGILYNREKKTLAA